MAATNSKITRTTTPNMAQNYPNKDHQTPTSANPQTKAINHKSNNTYKPNNT